MERHTPKIRVFSVEVRPDPDHYEIPIFGVEITGPGESWCETLATEMEVHAFLRGIQAGSAMTGGPYVSLPFEIEKKEEI